MQYKFLPIALSNKTAGTDESTPPDNPRTTLSFPNLAFKSAIVLSIKESTVQEAEEENEDPRRKRRRSSASS